jgi:hypothetical protein
MQEVHAALGGWESFYVVVGTSAAALTGLQFVVITLTMDGRMSTTTGTSSETIDAFASPTIVHFCLALLISATVSAPWPTLFGAASILVTAGIGGTAYTALVVWRATHQTGYKMVAEDWTWHVVLPLVAYVALFLAAIMLRRAPTYSLFAIAGTALFLLYIGIHNAWDTSTFLVARTAAEKRNAEAASAAARATEPAAASATAPGTDDR